MSDINKVANLSTNQLLKQNDTLKQNDGIDFAKHLKSAINEVNSIQRDSEQAIADLATGQVKDLHQAALAISKAETSMKLMLEIRNKALNAYKEVSRTRI
jgi:flagellar hook-basal body complex protein FliE